MENNPSNTTPTAPFLTVAQSAVRMDKSEEFVRLLCKEGQLPGAIQDYERGPWRIPTEAVEIWINTHTRPQVIVQRMSYASIGKKLLAIVTVLALVSGFVADSFGAFKGVQEVFATAIPTLTSTVSSTSIPTALPLPRPIKVTRPRPTPTITPTPDDVIVALATTLPTPNPEFVIKSRTVNGDIQQVWVPLGSFKAGDQINEDTAPPHQVYTDSFWIDRFLVTNAQYAKCVGASICSLPEENSSHRYPSYYDKLTFADYPVIQVSWQQANHYCYWRKSRLPTEAEFEKAAGWSPVTGEIQLFPWGNEPPNEKLANYNGSARDVTRVDTYPDGISPIGAYDMAGNLWEWVADWYSDTYYKDNTEWINPTGPYDAIYRVVRGGSWASKMESALRVSNRGRNNPNFASYEVGFRCVSTD
jgi:formylglycine-generating enzyme required for sulfatase activity